jgi:hypothetical protein
MTQTLHKKVAILVVVLLATTSVAPLVAAQATDETKRADLKVYQPHYVKGGVTTEDAGNYTVYTARGRVLELQPRNFAVDGVTDVSIKEDAGSIRYDADRRVWVFDTKGNDGTFTITFTVDEVRQKNVERNNTTVTVNESVTNHYRAVVKVKKTDLAHVSTSRVEELKRDAENWSEVEDLYGSVGSPHKPLEKKLQFGATLVDAWNNPGKALSGDFGMAVQAVFFSAGGLILFILIMLPNVVRNRKLRKENKELKEKIGDYEAIEDALDDVFTHKRKRYLKEKSWNDWFDDRTAAWLRNNFEPEPWSGFRRLLTMLSPGHLNGIVASAMLDSGKYVAVVEDDPDSEYAPDGGEDVVDVSRDVVDARMVDVDDPTVDVDELEQGLDEYERLVATSDKITTDVARQFDAATLDSEVLRSSDVELRSGALPVANVPDADADLVERLNVSIPEDFETREHFADVLATIIQKVAASEYATDDGEIDPQRDLANFLMGFSSIAGEAYNQPYFRNIRDLMIHNQERLDASKRIRTTVEEYRDRDDTNQGAGS